MQKKKDLVYKPNQTIMVTNGEITVTQRKAYNVILHKAWTELKINPEQTLFYFQIADIKKIAGIKAKNNVELKKNIKKLKRIEIENIKENGDWSIFSLISQAEKKGELLEIELPSKIRQALINNNFYTTLDLLTLKSLEGKYAVILYEVSIRYCKTQIPKLTIEEFKNLMGTENIKSYNNFARLKVKVIDPAIKEINKKTDIILSFTVRRQGLKVVAIKFYIEKKEAEQSRSENLKLEEKDEIKKIISNFRNVSGAELHPKRVEELVKEKGIEKINEYVKNFKKINRPGINNIASFFYKAVLEEYPLQKKSTGSNIPQHHNFKQRTYTKEHLQSLYEEV